MPTRFALSAFALATTIFLVACGDGTGPGEVDLSGTWSYSSTIQQDGDDCRIEDAPMFVEQQDNLLSGTLEIGGFQCGDLVCEGDASIQSVPLEFGQFQEEGTVEFEAHFLTHEGTASSDRMVGDLVASRMELSCGTFVEIIESGPGTWEATR